MIIDSNKVKKAKEFNWGQLPNLRALEEYKMLYNPQDFLFEIRKGPQDFDIDVYNAVKSAGYIRTDNIYVTQALYRLLDGVLAEPRVVDAYVCKYFKNNEEYEDYIAMPDDKVKRITEFLWNFSGTKTHARLSDNEQQLIFEYYGIDRKPVKRVSLEEFGQKNFYEQKGRRDPEKMAERCLHSALGKLKGYGEHFTQLYAAAAPISLTVDETREKLAEMMDPERERDIKKLIRRYVDESDRLGIEVSWDFVDIRYVYLNDIAHKLSKAGYDNLQQLLDGFQSESIKKKFDPYDKDYRLIRQNLKNFLYRYSIKTPPYLRE